MSGRHETFVCEEERRHETTDHSGRRRCTIQEKKREREERETVVKVMSNEQVMRGGHDIELGKNGTGK